MRPILQSVVEKKVPLIAHYQTDRVCRKGAEPHRVGKDFLNISLNLSIFQRGVTESDSHYEESPERQWLVSKQFPDLLSVEDLGIVGGDKVYTM